MCIDIDTDEYNIGRREANVRRRALKWRRRRRKKEEPWCTYLKG
jgi:hypothetical protein